MSCYNSVLSLNLPWMGSSDWEQGEEREMNTIPEQFSAEALILRISSMKGCCTAKPPQCFPQVSLDITREILQYVQSSGWGGEGNTAQNRRDVCPSTSTAQQTEIIIMCIWSLPLSLTEEIFTFQKSYIEICGYMCYVSIKIYNTTWDWPVLQVWICNLAMWS